MSGAPPVPPRPYHSVSSPPPLPPLPPDFRPDPLVAPRPQRLDPTIPANMARSLDEQAVAYPDFRQFSPTPPLPRQMPFPPYPSTGDYPQPQYRAPSAVPSTYTRPLSPPKPSVPPSLTAPLPGISTLSTALPAIQNPAHDPNLKVTWCRDVFFLVTRHQQIASTDAPVGPAYISDPQLARLAQVAVPLILQIAAIQPVPNPMPPYLAEAIYFRATFAASGSHPEAVPHNPRAAFRDFEQSARGGHAAAWFKLGRDYENFNDIAHARECFERGVKLAVESCTYRIGMAHLMGQLGLPASPEQAVPLLHRAATLASLDVPQPAYVYGLLLLGEFSHVTIPPNLFRPFTPAGSNPLQEARKHLERAAYLHFAPAQYKLGHAYEFAQPPFPFDALFSVQYYSLASQQGETEADMALSKWFLCGAEGAFEKDESLAWTFAEKAARKGLPSAEFAMGYYAEVGVGCQVDVDLARKWYIKASEHGNADAAERLQALSVPQPQALSRQEHAAITEHKLIRKRTQAKQRTATVPQGPPPGDGGQIIEAIRKNSLSAAANTPPPLQTQPPPTRQKHQLSSPDPAAVAAPRPRPPTERAPPSQNRYTLTDSPTPPPAPLGGRQPGGRLPTGSPGPLANVKHPSVDDSPQQPQQPTRRPTPHKGPTTFAEMGFQSARADDKECVIM